MVRLNIDLVEAFHAHRQFLQIVDDRPNLYAGPHVQIVIRRYIYKELKNWVHGFFSQEIYIYTN